MTETPKEITVKVYRFNPRMDKEAGYQTYKVPLEKGWSILNVLKHIYENLDSSLAFYTSCRIGKCNGCLVFVNGKSTRACTTPIRGNITIEPLKGFEVIKDLVVNLDKPKARKSS